MSDQKVRFYDRYHQKNNRYYKVIGRYNFTYFPNLQVIHQYLPSFAKKKILDVGCGVGTLSLYFAQQRAKSVQGLDVSQRAITICNEAKKALRFSNVQFKQGVLKKGKSEFDVVTCFEVIEHIEDDQQFLKLLHSQLKKGGLLLLSTPLEENILYGLGFYQKFDQEVGHLRRYRVDSLRKLIEKNGFKVLTMSRTEGILRNLLFTTKLGFFIKCIKGPLVPIFHLIDSMFIPLFGAVDVLVIAKKI